MKRLEFCNIIGGSLVVSNPEGLLAALKKDARPTFPGAGDAAAESVRYAPLKARRPWVPGSIPALSPFDWESLLANKEIRFLTENQLSIYVDSEHGIYRIHYFPVRKRPQLAEKLNYALVAKENKFSCVGENIHFQNADGTPAEVEESDYRWWPHKIERLWSANES